MSSPKSASKKPTKTKKQGIFDTIDIEKESHDMQSYGKQLAETSINVTSDVKTLKTKTPSTAVAPSTGFFCGELWDSLQSTGLFDPDLFVIDLYDPATIDRNLKTCFANMDTQPVLFTLRYLLQEMLLVFQGFKIHYSASKAFYKKFYEVTLAFGRNRVGLYTLINETSFGILPYIDELEDLLDTKKKSLIVHTYPDDFLQYNLVGSAAKKDLNYLEAQLQTIMQKIYISAYHKDVNFEDRDTYIGLIPVSPYNAVVDLKNIMDQTIAFPRIDVEKFQAEQPGEASEGETDADSPTSPTTVNSSHIIRTTSFTAAKVKSSGRRVYEIWRYFVIKNYKSVFELLDPAFFPKNQFISSAFNLSGQSDDLSQEFLLYLINEFQKVVRRYEKVVCAIEVSAYPSYTHTIPNLALRVFWGKYLGDVFEVNLKQFQKALQEYLILEVGYNASKAKSFSYPVIKALVYYATLMSVPASAANAGIKQKVTNTPPPNVDDSNMDTFSVTIFDISLYTESIPPSEADTLVKFFKTFVKMHLNVSVAVFPNQDHLGNIVNPYAAFPDKEFKKAVFNLKSRKGWVNIPTGLSPRGSGRSTTILYLLNRIKSETNILYLDFNHSSSEASLIASLMSQLHLKYTYGSSFSGSVPVQNINSLSTATRYITKELFMTYFEAFLEKLNKDAVIVFDNVEPQGYSYQTSSISLSRSNSFSSLISGPTRKPTISRTNSAGLNANNVVDFLDDLIAFIGNGALLRKFTFVLIGGSPDALAEFEKDGTAKPMDLPTYDAEQLQAMAQEIYPPAYQSLYNLSNGNVGHMATVSDVFSLKTIKSLSTAYLAVRPEEGTIDECDLVLKETIFKKIQAQILGKDDELLVASLLLPNIGSFHYSYAWYMCKNAFGNDLFKFHAAFMNLNRLGYFDYQGNGIYHITKFYNPDQSYIFRNHFSTAGYTLAQLAASAPKSIKSAAAVATQPENPQAIPFPFDTSVILQTQWDLYYEFWAKEMARMNYLSFVSPQVLDYFPTIYPHFRLVFGNFGVFPKLTIANPRRPSRKMVINLDSYEKFKAKALAASKEAPPQNIAPAASATAPVVVDQSKLKTSKLNDLALNLAGGVSSVLLRYYPSNAGQMITASILEAIDVDLVSRAISSNVNIGIGEDEFIIAGEGKDDDEDDDDTFATQSQFNSSAPSVHPLEEKYYGALCDFVEQLLRPDTESLNPTVSIFGYSNDIPTLKQAASILNFFFTLKALSRSSVQPALIWIRCLVLTANVKHQLRQEKKAKQYYERAYEMITDLETTLENPGIANDPLEPLGKYKSDLVKLLVAPPVTLGSFATPAQDDRAASISRQSSGIATSALKRGASASSLPENGSDKKCAIM